MAQACLSELYWVLKTWKLSNFELSYKYNGWTIDCEKCKKITEMYVI